MNNNNSSRFNGKRAYKRRHRSTEVGGGVKDGLEVRREFNFGIGIRRKGMERRDLESVKTDFCSGGG